MNPHSAQPTSLAAMIGSIWRNRSLIGQMTRREVLGRYKGSLLGVLWSFFNPLLMLAVYTFVFSVVFRARWSTTAEETKLQFAVILFVGMIVHGLFAEVLNRSPSLILSNVNFVKKVVFPLEILPIIALCATLFHTMISLLVLLVAFLVFNGFLHPTIIYAPLVLFPLIVLVQGLAWILASLGVFVRDISPTMAIVTTIMLFMAPVFYPITALPEGVQVFVQANPLTFIIEQSREVLIWGRVPDWKGLLNYFAMSIAVAWVGYYWFQKTRKGFADVL